MTEAVKPITAAAPLRRVRTRARSRWWLAAGLLVTALLWSYAPVLRELAREWERDPNYSVGALVLPAAGYIAWLRRRRLAALPRTGHALGLLLLSLTLALRWFGLQYGYESAERLSLVGAIVAAVTLLGGRHAAWALRWVLLFLLLMLPLPGRLHNAVSGPLQQQAVAGTFVVLELLGITVAREGNLLVLNGRVEMGVVEACSGLRMLTAFVVVAAVLAFLIDRPRWQKGVLVLSSVPIAILCNLVRLTVTALLYLLSTARIADIFFHDFAGISMMPLAIAVLLAELWILDRLVVRTPEPGRAA